MNAMDKIIEDLIKGAKQAGANVIVRREGGQDKVASTSSRLNDAFSAGAQAAAARFGVKTSGFVGQMAGAMGGQHLASMLPIKNKLLSGAAQMGGQMLGGMAAEKVMPQL